MQLTPRLIVAFVLFGVACGCLALANSLFFAMLREVNGRLPPERRVPRLGDMRGRHQMVLREYRRLCPAGRLPLYEKAAALLGVAAGLAFWWQIGGFSGLFHGPGPAGGK
jgi:hypothetical protein